MYSLFSAGALSYPTVPRAVAAEGSTHRRRECQETQSQKRSLFASLRVLSASALRNGLSLFALISCLSVGSAESQPADAKIETRFFRFTLSPANSHCEILDKETQTVWRPQSSDTAFGKLILETETKARPIN